MKLLSEMNPFSILRDFERWYEWASMMIQMEHAMQQWCAFDWVYREEELDYQI